MHKRVTHQDVASHLGLSQSTVSRALRADPRIPEETKARIRRACDKLGYRPNPHLSELAESRWHKSTPHQASIIAYIECSRTGGFIEPLLSEALRRQGLLFGYHVEKIQRRDFKISAQLQRMLRHRGITDIILGPFFEDSLTVELDWSKFICVQLMPDLFSLPLHSVTRDVFGTVLLAWRQAVNHGYKRIGAVLLNHPTPTPLMDDVMRNSAARACQSELFPHLPNIPIIRHYTYDPAHYDEFMDWFHRYRPEVIISFNEVHYYYLRSMPLKRMPAYISLHNLGSTEISSIYADPERCAVESVNLLHFCRKAYQWGIPERQINHVIEPGWFEGSTLPYKKLSADK